MTETLLLALDSGTSVVKAVAFTASGRAVASAARPNRPITGPSGAAEQDMAQTWDDAAGVLAELMTRLPAGEVAALAVTAQGDGTWLIDAEGEPVAPAWLWLDARAAGLVEQLRESGAARSAFAYTGTGLAACQQSAQLLWLARERPALLRRAATAMHCKDFLHFKLTGERATDPSEACFTFGDYRTRSYRPEVLAALGLGEWRHLLPPIVDGTQQAHRLTKAAAAQIGLPAGLPVVLGYVDMTCTALGAGVYGTGEDVGVSIVGSTGIHLRLIADPDRVTPSEAMTGYCAPFPVPGHTTHAQTNMAGTLNIDWLLARIGEAAMLAVPDAKPDRASALRRLDAAVAEARPGATLYHPFISSAGERGPFNDPYARAALLGLDQDASLADLARGIYEGLAFAARDCYAAIGGVPREIHLTGGAARSRTMQRLLAASLDRPVRSAAQKEAGAAGAAMIAAVCIGLFPDMAECAGRWTRPGDAPATLPDPDLVRTYAVQFEIYQDTYRAMRGFWRRLHKAREGIDAILS